MSILVYTESEQGKLKKGAFEVASYAKAVANQLGTTVTAVTINANSVSELGNYGVDKVLSITNGDHCLYCWGCGLSAYDLVEFKHRSIAEVA